MSRGLRKKLMKMMDYKMLESEIDKADNFYSFEELMKEFEDE